LARKRPEGEVQDGGKGLPLRIRIRTNSGINFERQFEFGKGLKKKRLEKEESSFLWSSNPAVGSDESSRAVDSGNHGGVWEEGFYWWEAQVGKGTIASPQVY